MPRDEHSSSRRTFLRACAATTAAAALPAALGCSGPQDLPEPPRLAEVAARPDPVPAPPAPTPPRSPWLAALREVSLADGLEPATVFVAAVEE